MTDASTSDTLLEINGLWKIFNKQHGDFDPQDLDAIEHLRNNGAVVAVQNISF